VRGRAAAAEAEVGALAGARVDAPLNVRVEIAKDRVRKNFPEAGRLDGAQDEIPVRGIWNARKFRRKGADLAAMRNSDDYESGILIVATMHPEARVGESVC